MLELEGKVKSLTSCLEQQKLFLEQSQEEYNSITEVNEGEKGTPHPLSSFP